MSNEVNEIMIQSLKERINSFESNFVRKIDLETNYIKKDDLEYRRIQERTQKNSEDIAEMKKDITILTKELEKNTKMTETINSSNIRSETSLDNIKVIITEIKDNVKEQSVKMESLNLENSKNTDSRLTTKQIIISIATALLLMLLGASLAVSGLK